jgi:hypothetical protein
MDWFVIINLWQKLLATSGSIVLEFADQNVTPGVGFEAPINSELP